MPHKHWSKGDPEYDRAPTCKLTVAQCDDRLQEWQAAQQVALARTIVAEGRVKRYRRDGGVFAQLVLLVAGETEAIVNGDGVESQAKFAQRLMRLAAA